MVKIGVLLPSRFADGGEYLADARALDAAGVDSLWLPDDGLDAWAILASVARATGGTRLMVPVSDDDIARPEAFARRIGTLDRLSRGRVLLTVPETGPAPVAGAAGGCGRRGRPGGAAAGVPSVGRERPRHRHAADRRSARGGRGSGSEPGADRGS